MIIGESHIDEQAAWQQLLNRDPGASFFYGVATTGVFCRPNCKSRLPRRENARFFASVPEARAAGFRACLRCKPEEPKGPPAVSGMCSYLERNLDRPVRLATLGRLTGLSPFTAQRIFKQAMGVTPAQYQRTLRANALRSQLRAGKSSVTAAIYEAGYGSSSRAYEAAPLGMPPGRFLAGGRGETVRYATAPAGPDSQFGWIIAASTDRGICWVALGDSERELEDGLRAEFPAATIRADGDLAEAIAVILNRIEGQSGGNTLPLDLRGTAFQLRVWNALRLIPCGETRSYSQLAGEMGDPAATRAVARACATNRVAVLVPCHRVVGASGSLTGYRWGLERKRQLLASEAGKTAL